jgi:hypothetical protein
MAVSLELINHRFRALVEEGGALLSMMGPTLSRRPSLFSDTGSSPWRTRFAQRQFRRVASQSHLYVTVSPETS